MLLCQQFLLRPSQFYQVSERSIRIFSEATVLQARGYKGEKKTAE